MRKFFLISMVMLITGLIVGTGEYFYLNRSTNSYEIEFERYENKTYGYSIEVPKSCGAIMPYGENFTDNLYDEMEEIGPFIPRSAICESCYLSLDVFTDKEASESWVDFYKRIYLDTEANVGLSRV